MEQANVRKKKLRNMNNIWIFISKMKHKKVINM